MPQIYGEEYTCKHEDAQATHTHTHESEKRQRWHKGFEETAPRSTKAQATQTQVTRRRQERRHTDTNRRQPQTAQQLPTETTSSGDEVAKAEISMITRRPRHRMKGGAAHTTSICASAHASKQAIEQASNRAGKQAGKQAMGRAWLRITQDMVGDCSLWVARDSKASLAAILRNADLWRDAPNHAPKMVEMRATEQMLSSLAMAARMERIWPNVGRAWQKLASLWTEFARIGTSQPNASESVARLARMLRPTTCNNCSQSAGGGGLGTPVKSLCGGRRNTEEVLNDG